MQQRYRSLNSWLKEIFGVTVRKVSIDAGLGCPNRPGGTGPGGCIYCNERGSGTGASSKNKTISEQLEQGISFLSSRYQTSKFIAYFQSYSNTYGDPDHLATLYKEALDYPGVVGLAIGTRPDCVADKTLDLLAELNEDTLIWVELGLQSAHKKTLELINRGHDFETFAKTTERLLRRDINVVAHLILGLPNETISDMIVSARMISDLGVNGVKLHPLYIVRGSALEQFYNEGLYNPMTLEQSIKATLEVASYIAPGILIHRLTSDPHKHELVAPQWMLDKRSVRTFLEAEMERTNFIQGSKLQ
ncbi:MAG: TIGR01212 family radical SAM protein [Desulfomonilaceae bacterium]